MNLGYLGYVVSRVLGFNRKRWGKKNHKIVGAIFRAMATALQNGEDVHIKGLGIFKVRTRKANRRGQTYFSDNKPSRPYEVVLTPEKRYIHFTPTKPILRELNHESQ